MRMQKQAKAKIQMTKADNCKNRQTQRCHCKGARQIQKETNANRYIQRGQI